MVKKIFKRIISIVLILNVILGCFSGCAGTIQTTGGEYMTKGEFFAAFIDLRNLYSDYYTIEEMENSETYDIEAQIMVEWGLLTEKQVKNTHKPVTLEIVAQACVNNILYRQTCDVEIKNISKATDPQAIKDVVGMGFVELEKQNFDYNKKLSETEVNVFFDKIVDYEMNSSFEEKPFEITLKENVVDLTDIEIQDFRVIPNNTTEYTQLRLDGKPIASSLNKKTADINAETNDMVTFKIPRLAISPNVANPFKQGKIVLISEDYKVNSNFHAFANCNLHLLKNPVAVEITRPVEFDGFAYMVVGRVCDLEEVAEDDPEGEGVNVATSIPAQGYIEENDDGTQTSGVIGVAKSNATKTSGKFSVKPLSNGIKASFSGTMGTLLEKKYTGNQSWRNALAEMDVTIDAAITDISIDVNNLGKLLYNIPCSSAQIIFKYTANLDVSVKSKEMKYAPANNGNGGLKIDDEGVSGNLFANVANARATASDKGADRIKLAQITFPLGYGFTIGADVYLYINFDGTVRISIEQTNKIGIAQDKNGKKRSVTENLKDQKNIDASVNIYSSLSLEPNLKLLKVNILDGNVALVADVEASATFYNDEGALDFGGVVSPTAANIKAAGEYDWSYCANAYIKAYIDYGLLTDSSKLGQILSDDIKAKLKGSTKEKPFFEMEIHVENFEVVKKCTRGQEHENKVEKNSNGEIVLDSYKYFMSEYTCIHANLLSAPIDEEALGDCVIIKSGNDDIVTATYIPSLNAISLSGNGAGSTEVEIKIRNKNNKKKKEYYSLYFSVTVNAMTDIDFDGSIDKIVPFNLENEASWLVGKRYL